MSERAHLDPRLQPLADVLVKVLVREILDKQKETRESCQGNLTGFKGYVNDGKSTTKMSQGTNTPSRRS